MATDAEPDPDALRPRDIGAPEGDALLVNVAAAAPRKLSEELQRLIDEFATGSVTVRELIAVLHGRAYDLLLLLLALPFLVPVPLPGLSTPFGAVIGLIAARLVLGQRPWLPQKLLNLTLPPKFFPVLLGAARRVLRALELLLRPRLLWVTSARLPQLHAFVILVGAILLLLPLPPGTNFPPAVLIVMMAAGLLERDGVFILCGYVVLALNVVFFALLGIYGTKLFELVWQWVRGLFA